MDVEPVCGGIIDSLKVHLLAVELFGGELSRNKVAAAVESIRMPISEFEQREVGVFLALTQPAALGRDIAAVTNQRPFERQLFRGSPRDNLWQWPEWTSHSQRPAQQEAHHTTNRGSLCHPADSLRQK